jgi:hypothetical protein
MILLLLLGALAHAQTDCTALSAGLTSSSADTRERAARAVYEKCPPATTRTLPDLNASLRKSVQLGNASAAALLLLGRYQDPETRSFLEQRTSKALPKVKLDPWQPPVPLGLAAAVAAVSAGSESARARLTQGLSPIEESEFLASSIPAIQDRASLRALVKLLDDERTVNTGVPSGATPRLRIADLALEAFCKRFELTPFPLRPGDRYSPSEIASVAKLVLQRLTP